MVTDQTIDTLKPYNDGPGYNYTHSLKAAPDIGADKGRIMNDKIIKVESVLDSHEKLMAEIRSELKAIRSDMLHNQNRIVDKIDENQKWLVAMIVSSILIPLLIALVTK